MRRFIKSSYLIFRDIKLSGYLLAVASVVLGTSLFLLGRDYFAKGQWALLYLLIIGFVANVAGF